MQPGQQREGNHAEQEGQHDAGIDLAGTQEYHQHHIGQLEKRGPLAQESRSDVHARICEVRHRRSQH